jgi:hypothetical protein
MGASRIACLGIYPRPISQGPFACGERPYFTNISPLKIHCFNTTNIKAMNIKKPNKQIRLKSKFKSQPAALPELKSRHGFDQFNIRHSTRAVPPKSFITLHSANPPDLFSPQIFSLV